MEKLTKEDGESPDLLADNIERLREIFPEVFADGHVDFDALKQTLGEYVDDQDERYSFTWHGKSRARQIAQMPSAGTLIPCREESVNWDSTKNVFIEGDNLEVLKLLQKSYHRKVKMIYIDPPYNTGQEFIYPDKWQDNLDTYLRYTGQVDDEGLKLSANTETSGRYHTNWLNMMYPRLRLARNLLTSDGAIFVSIDDHEFHNLRHMMDEIFGPENFIASVTWQKAYAPRNNAPRFSESHEYILVYSRDSELVNIKRLPATDEQRARYKNPDSDSRGDWKTGDLTVSLVSGQRGRTYQKTGRGANLYSMAAPSGREIAPSSGRCWVYSREKMEELDRDNRIWWGKSGNNVPQLKRFWGEIEGGIVCQTVWAYDEVGTNQDASREVKELFSDFQSPVFPTAKPTRLLQRCMELICDSGDLILDFFAGSCSLADAVISSEKACRFMVVQLPEPTEEGSEVEQRGLRTVADIGKERIRRAISKNEREGSVGFRVLKLSGSSFSQWDTNFDTLEDDLLSSIESIRPNRTDDDVLFELLLKYGLDLSTSIDTKTIGGRSVFIIGAGALVVCLEDSVTVELVEAIAALKDSLRPELMRVVFRDSGFENDAAKANAVYSLRQRGVHDVRSV